MLIKASSPGWEKVYTSKDELVDELRSHICGSCRKGQAIYIGDGGVPIVYEDDAVVDTEYDGKVYECRDINTLLGTACGMEFWVEETD